VCFLMIIVVSFSLFLSVDAIVCVDACFTQKRRKNQGKAWVMPLQHPATAFVSTEEVDNMERVVEDARPAPHRSHFQQNQSHGLSSTNLDYESGMHVPTAVLDECNNSFTAADSNRVKASTQFFADTGLMALLCRHDRVLWLVNMTSAGEKQHYVLTLLDKLFQNIPLTMRIGFLYDIACQLHRSCVKFGFLSHALDRIVFAISVFHAYGHQWPCQIVYHPRKCPGFGLSDGESCERFWSSIKLLIPSLRVSGYYNRIYTLDTQVKHLDHKSLLDLGNWLRRKWLATAERKERAVGILGPLFTKGMTPDFLRGQWLQQIAEQTKPLKRQSKDLANKEIETILSLLKTLEGHKQDIIDFQNMLVSGSYTDGMTADEIQLLLDESQEHAKHIQKSISSKKSKLSVDGRLNLTKLIDDVFLKTRMNALALKQRIRDRLSQRKFELENLERAYRKTMNHIKLEKHAQGQIKKKEPGIQVLARKYNTLCDELTDLIRKKHAPRGAIVPVYIDINGLFKLDVDDDIWHDIGLSDDIDALQNIPPWLGDENVREGIKALLELDRCEEEERRLVSECISMQQWMKEEWLVLCKGMENALEDPAVTFQFAERQKLLLRLCHKWMPAIQIIPYFGDDCWGPSMEELLQASTYETEEQVWNSYSDDDIEDDELLKDTDSEEAELFDIVEIMALNF